MTRVVAAVLLSLFTASSAFAHQAGTACAAKARGRDGKPLDGAAKRVFLQKCCDKAAVGSDGEPLSGAAKRSFVLKCQTGK
jgi:hypothetical protein